MTFLIQNCEFCNKKIAQMFHLVQEIFGEIKKMWKHVLGVSWYRTVEINETDRKTLMWETLKEWKGSHSTFSITEQKN